MKAGDFPGGPVVKTLHFHRRGCGFDPRSGTKIPPTAQRGQKTNKQNNNNNKNVLEENVLPKERKSCAMFSSRYS